MYRIIATHSFFLIQYLKLLGQGKMFANNLLAHKNSIMINFSFFIFTELILLLF